MNQLRAIRKRLNVTQAELGRGIGCTQPNIGHYEVDRQCLPPDRAKAVIEFSAARGLALTMGQVYGIEPLPPSGQSVQDGA